MTETIQLTQDITVTQLTQNVTNILYNVGSWFSYGYFKIVFPYKLVVSLENISGILVFSFGYYTAFISQLTESELSNEQFFP